MCLISEFEAKQRSLIVPLCPNNRSKGQLGVTFCHFPVDKYTKKSGLQDFVEMFAETSRFIVIVFYDFKISKL